MIYNKEVQRAFNRREKLIFIFYDFSSLAPFDFFSFFHFWSVRYLCVRWFGGSSVFSNIGI
jgi:hypothetical protein